MDNIENKTDEKVSQPIKFNENVQTQNNETNAQPTKTNSTELNNSDAFQSQEFTTNEEGATTEEGVTTEFDDELDELKEQEFATNEDGTTTENGTISDLDDNLKQPELNEDVQEQNNEANAQPTKTNSTELNNSDSFQDQEFATREESATTENGATTEFSDDLQNQEFPQEKENITTEVNEDLQEQNAPTSEDQTQTELVDNSATTEQSEYQTKTELNENPIQPETNENLQEQEVATTENSATTEKKEFVENENQKTNTNIYPSVEYTKTNYKQKHKKNIRKLIITLILIALTIIIALIAVIAYTTQDFTVENRLLFEARHIDANINVGVTNAGTAVELINPEFDIASTDPEGKQYAVAIPKQDFEGSGQSNAIMYIITIKNTSATNANFTINLRDIPYKTNIKSESTFNRDDVLVNNGCSLTKNQILTIRISLILLENLETQASYEFKLDLQVV